EPRSPGVTLSLDAKPLRLHRAAVEAICLGNFSLALLEYVAVLFIEFVLVTKSRHFLRLCLAGKERNHEITIGIPFWTAAIQSNFGFGQGLGERLVIGNR